MTGARIAIPADFAQHATTLGWEALRKLYRKDTPTLQRWIAETGVVRPVLKGGRVKREVPADFAAMSAKHTNVELMAIYGCGSEMLYRWRKETGAKRRDKMVIPDDFAERWKTNGILKLAAHYGRNHTTISTWIAKLGLRRPRGQTLTQQAKRAEPKPVKAPVARNAAPVRSIKPDAYRTAPLDRVQRDMSAAGRAADTLRRDRWTVFRCDEKGHADPAGKMWLCGRIIVTSAELIERAERAERRMAA